MHDSCHAYMQAHCSRLREIQICAAPVVIYIFRMLSNSTLMKAFQLKSQSLPIVATTKGSSTTSPLLYSMTSYGLQETRSSKQDW